MIWFGIIFLLLLAGICWVCFSKLSIIIEYRKGKLKITFKSKLFRYTLDDKRLKSLSESKGRKTEQSDGSQQSVEGFLGKVEKLKRQYQEFRDVIDAVLDYAGDRTEFSDIFVSARFGTGDAAYTGMIYGAIWSVIGNAYAFLCRFFRIEFPEVELVPEFNEKVFEIEAEGIIKIRLAHIITAILHGLRTKRKNKKGVF